MKEGILYDTGVLSFYLNRDNGRFAAIQSQIRSLRAEAVEYVSVISLAELEFGVRVAESRSENTMNDFRAVLRRATEMKPLDITVKTAAAYAEFKAVLAQKCVHSAVKRRRPRFLEDWVHVTTGKELQVDENDLWLCAQAKERGLTLVTLDKKMRNIGCLNPGVQLEVLQYPTKAS